MFKMPKAFHVQVVEPLPLEGEMDSPTPTKPPVDFARLSVIAKHLSTDLAGIGITVYTAKKLVDTLSEVAVIAAKAKFK